MYRSESNPTLGNLNCRQDKAQFIFIIVIKMFIMSIMSLDGSKVEVLQTEKLETLAQNTRYIVTSLPFIYRIEESFLYSIFS